MRWRSTSAFVNQGIVVQQGASGSRSQELVAKVNGLVGDCKPLGYFDPFGFSKDASPETMKK